MIRDPRSGHNRKRVNENFFKTWSPSMAYILGLILADGDVEDVRKSSRTCYVQITSIDKELLDQVKTAMASSHRLYERPGSIKQIYGRTVKTSKAYNLRIGNKVLFQDLVNLGVTPRKSLRLKLPFVSDDLFKFLLRGYFDGDGSIGSYRQRGKTSKRLSTTFTSGCGQFLENISIKLHNLLGIKENKVYFLPTSHAYHLMYRDRSGKEMLSYIYENLYSAPFLGRKYKIYSDYLNLQQKRVIAV